MPKYLSCFPSGSRSTRLENDQLLTLTDSSDVETKDMKAGCIFCKVSLENGFAVVYEDNDLIAFKDRLPGAETHLLIIPRKHSVSTVRDLTSSHLPLLQSMHSLGVSLVPSSPPPKMGYHIPPFSSVHHLHLHVLSGRPTFFGRFKYPISNSKSSDIYNKGWSWFVTSNQLQGILERGGKVALGSS